MGVTATLAEFASGFPRGETGTADVTATALTDTVAVAIAGAATPAAKLLAGWLEDEERADGPAAAWGAGELRAPSQAALRNGTAAHALDWDDAAPSMPMHPGAVLFPALLAWSARQRVSGPDLVAAYDVGNAVFRAVTELLPDDVHYGRGWHTTATVGRLAATAAVIRLAGGALDARAARSALGIAATCAAGSLANFGTMTKPLHAGVAARDAVTACALAGRGYTASETQLEDQKGFLALYGAPAADRAAGFAGRLTHWAARWPDDWAVKQYPSCYATHRTIDAVRWLRSAAGLTAVPTITTVPEVAEVAAVRVVVRSGGLRPLIGHRPRTGLEGKFSLPYTVATALRHGTVRLGDFTDAAVGSTDARLLMDRVTVTESDAVPGVEVELELRDGRRLTRRVDVSHGDARDPLTPAEAGDKARDALGAAGWTHGEADALAAALAAAVRAPRLDHLQRLLASPALARDDASEVPNGRP